MADCTLAALRVITPRLGTTVLMHHTQNVMCRTKSRDIQREKVIGNNEPRLGE